MKCYESIAEIEKKLKSINTGEPTALRRIQTTADI